VKKFDLLSFATADDLARAATGSWLDEIENANRTGKLHCVALSGGRIAKNLFDSVVELNKVRKVSFEGVHFFWADERCVPPTAPESNFKMAEDLLFKPLKILQNQIHRIRGEDSPSVAVKTAERELRQLAPPDETNRPILDLIFLGMGEDGHVASLFPNATSDIANHPGPFLIVENSPKPPPRRISLSFAVIGAAKEVWVLISGAGKEDAFRKSLDMSRKVPLTPLGRVVQMRQKTLIFSQIEAEKKI
jgi:6-phosphogluconolactonase